MTVRAKILIGIPCHSTIDSAFAQSLTRLVEFMVANKYVVKTQFYEGTLITTARQRLVDIALRDKADHLFFLDSDMIFQYDTLQRLINIGEDIVSTLFFKRIPPYQPCFYTKVDLTEPLNPAYDVPVRWNDKGIYKCDATGLACTLISKKVLLALEGTQMFEHPSPVGEDIAFCLNARDKGFSVYADTRIEAGHIGRLVVTEELYKEYHKKEETK
jgi:hypothetical protein